MKILTRYLVSTYLGMIATCLGALVAIYLVVDFLERFTKFSSCRCPFDGIVPLFPLQVAGDHLPDRADGGADGDYSGYRHAGKEQ